MATVKYKERPTDFRAATVDKVKVKLVKPFGGHMSRAIVDLPEFQARLQIAAGVAIPWPPVPAPSVSEGPPMDKSMSGATKAGKVKRK